MTQPEISIFTCSHNNPGHIAVVISSVLRQTFSNFEYFILENSTDGMTRGIISNFDHPRIKVIEEKSHDEDDLKNKYFPKASGRYIMVLSDNDILMTNCFQEHIIAFELNQNARAFYHAIEVVYTYSNRPGYQIPARNVFGHGLNPEGKVDLGSIMFERSLLDKIPYPLFGTEKSFVHRLSLVTDIYPIEQALHIKRMTADR